MPMNELLKLIACALGAVAGATAILAALGTLPALLAASLGGAVNVAAGLAPVAVCAGGVAYAASRTGYDAG